MWTIFILSAIAIFFGVIVLSWITNKVLISMERDNHKYELEVKNDLENKNKEEDEK